jgi:hypothetical protein
MMIWPQIEDKTLEIPAYLVRNPDNTLKYPGIAKCVVTRSSVTDAVTIPTERWPRNPADDIVREHLLGMNAAQEKELKQANDRARREQKALDKQSKDARVKEQKQVFAKYFEWDCFK